MSDSKIDVLIVGAGPVGLTMASFLQHYGVSFRIIDKKDQPTQTSNAVGVQARTLELLEEIGLSEKIAAGGRHIRSAHYFMHRKKIGTLDFNTVQSRYPYVCCIPQSKTEAVFNEHLTQAGITIERSTTLENIEKTNDSLLATIKNAQGNEIIYANYVIACDGYHSTVREFADIKYEGKDLGYRFLMIDSPVTWDQSLDSMYIATANGLALAMFPMKDSVRMIADISKSPALKKLEQADEKVFSEIVKQCLGTNTMKISKPLWQSAFWIHERLSNHYRDGNIFFMGDAAHAHSPAGGQGMNTGMQDAINLAWKLVLAIKHKGNKKLLDSFETERRPVAKTLITNASKATNIMLSNNPLYMLVRKFIFPRLLGMKSFKAAMSTAIAEVNINYRKSPLVSGNVQGNIKPGMRITSLHTPLKGKHLLIDTAGDARNQLNDYQNIIDIVDLAQAPEALKYLQGYCLIRPDYYVAYVGSKVEDIKNYLRIIST
jgi:2-polyprenyl-6-methoxyphenol hydroxylase-like FAD-dependent oxidoreductase